MDFQAGLMWWIAAGLAVAAELATGTFYLLMVALGLAAGGLAATAGQGLVAQLLAAAAVGGGAVALWTWRRGQGSQPVDAQANPDVLPDIGQRVHVAHWREGGRVAQVHYRGAQWQARWQGPEAAPGPGDFHIVAVDGNELQLGR